MGFHEILHEVGQKIDIINSLGLLIHSSLLVDAGVF